MNYVLRAVDEEIKFKIWAVNAKELVQKAKNIHSLNNMKTIKLGQALMANALMSVKLKSEKENISIKIFSPKDIGSILTASTLQSVKGYVIDVQTEEERAWEPYLRLSESYDSKEIYAGTVSIENDSVCDALKCYLDYSEQTNSFVYLDVRLDDKGDCEYAGGLIIQSIPNDSIDKNKLDNNEEQFDINKKVDLETIRQMVDKNITMDKIITNALKGVKVKKLMQKHITYECDCSRKKFLSKVLTIGLEQIMYLLEQDGKINVTCPFCCNQYEYDEVDFRCIKKSGNKKQN